MTSTTTLSGGEGCLNRSWIKTEADFNADALTQLLEAKHHDKALQIGYGHENPSETMHTYSRVQKRSYKRAFRRALATGSAWYRGQCMTPDQFAPGLSIQLNRACPLPKKPPPSSHTPRHRMQIGHVNVGGLATEKLHEVKIWATQSALDILLLSETRWNFTSEWTDDTWYHLHTGTAEDKADGLLFLIRRTLCSAEQIGFAAPMPGRLGHLRLHFHKRSMDLLGCYQYASTPHHHKHNHRHEFWQKLEHQMALVPNRNSAVIIGDFNCSALVSGPHVGTNQYTWGGKLCRSPPHRDSSLFLEFLQKFHLTILNSWNAKNPPTYDNQLTASSIDHVIMRIADVDNMAKDVKLISKAPFVPMTGARHIPMICSVRKIPYAFTRSATSNACSFQQRLRCRRAWQMQDDQWQQFHDSFTQSFADFTAQSQNDSTLIDDLHRNLMPVFHHAFPKERSSAQPLSTPNPVQTQMIRSKWQHLAHITQSTSTTLRSLFEVWFHYGRYRTLKRQQQRMMRQLKRQKLQDLLTEVTHASQRHDSFAVFQVIRKYTPKQPLKKIRLRLPDGTPANPTQVMQMTQAYIREIWHSSDPIFLRQPAPVGVPFSLEELEQEIACIPLTKAVARSCLPGTCWKTNARSVAVFIYAKLQQWWTQFPVFIPQQWKDAHLTFINKPAKSPDRLEHLRPLALLEPVGKCVLGILTKKFAAEIQPLISPWPQPAFLKQRSTFDAIRKVIHHCALVRTLTASQRRSVHERAMQEPCHQVCGGLQVLLDANKAFDLVPRSTLFQFLNDLPISQVLITLLSEWHDQTAYIVNDGITQQRVATGRGVRQGCRAAPVLWTSHTLHLFYKLRDLIDATWIKQCLTVFADDLHCCEVFRSETQLQAVLQRIGILLDTLEVLGVQLSLEKSHAIIKIGGTNCRDIQRKYILTDAQGPYILIPRAHGGFSRLPVRTQAKYLGVMVGYNLFERKTVQMRIKAARHSFARLRRWLCSKQIPKKTRLQLWHSCVFSTLVYGIFSTGFTQTDLLQLQQCIFTMYRQLVGDHSYLTHHTHAAVLHIHGLDHPLSLLLHAGRQLQDTLSRRLNQLDHDDIVWTIDWTHLTSLLQLIHCTWQDQHQALLTIPAAAELHRPFQCQYCEIMCNSLSNLRLHMTIVHGLKQLRTHFTTVASFAVRGLPQCSHCLEVFPTWRNFQIHLERDCCQALSRTPPMLEPSALTPSTEQEYPKLTHAQLTLLLSKPYGPTALSHVQDRNWDALQQLPAATTDWAHHCVLCGVYCNRPQDLNLHMRTQHPSLLPHVMSKASQLGRAQASNSPCRFCNKTFRRTHQCPVMVQAALLLVNTDATGHSYSCPGDSVLRCDVCAEQFQEILQLHCHLHEQHRLEPLDWDPLRDMLAGSEPVCSHCLAIFAEKSALRQHITLGQCMSFNPARQPTELSVTDEWQELIASGDLERLHQAPQKRLHLTLRCQFCQTAFQRTGDLSLHLQTVHSKLWGAAQSHVQLLIEASQRIGCLCNPQTNASGLQHICVAYRQIGMMVQKMTLPMFLPWTFERAQMRQFLQAVISEPIGNHLCEVLHNRDFASLWTDPMLVRFLRTRCLLCGQQLHAAEVTGHLHCVHAPDLPAHRTLLPQLISAVGRENQTDYRCDVCQQIYNYPPAGNETSQELSSRSVLAQIHLQHQCPVVLQLAILLGDHGVQSTAHCRRLRNVGNLQANEPSFEDGALRQARRRQKPQETQDGNAPNRRVQRRRHSPIRGDGAPSAESGCRATSAQASRLMDLLHANRVAGHTASPSPEGRRMEAEVDGETRDIRTACPSATLPLDPALGRDASSPGDQTGTVHQRGPSEEGGTGAGPSDTGGALSLPEVELSCPEPSPNESGTHLPAEDGEVLRTTDRHLERHLCDSEIPQLKTDVERGCGALALANFDAIGRSPGPADHVAGEHCMGPPRHVDEAACPLSEQTGPTASGHAWQGPGQDSGQRPGQAPKQDFPEDDLDALPVGADLPARDVLLKGLATLRLANDANWCYVNAAVLTMLWSFLSISTFTLDHWGSHATRIVQLLMQHDNEPVELSSIAFLQPIFAQWQNLGNQGDPVEFLAHVMRGLNLTGINLSWEKRVQIGLLTEVVDESDAYNPLILRFDPAMLQDDSLTLCQMIRDWSNQDGMLTALTHQTPLVCVQLDRNIRSGTGEIAKCDIPVNFHWGIDLPIYDSDGLQIQWKTYRVIAAIAHLGHDTAGHCRTLLRVQMNATAREPHMFLLTEDWLKAVPVWKEPSWFLRNITCFWLGEWDQVALYDLPVSTSCHAPCPPTPARPVVIARDLLSHFAEGTDETDMPS